MEFKDRVVVVTGGASGIGAATVAAFAAAGAKVGICDIDEEGVTRVAAEHPGAFAVPMDVVDADGVKAAIDDVAAAHGGIDILANVAGWDRVMPFVDTDPAFWDRVIAVNYRGVLATCRAVIPHMVAKGGGVIVNTASEAGRNGSSGEAVYSGTKGAVIAFSKALAREVSRHRIRVNVVAPGLVDTPLLQGMIADGHDKLMDAIVKATPIRRFGRPEEVAEAILFLASDRASFITGQTLGVSGGLVMG